MVEQRPPQQVLSEDGRNGAERGEPRVLRGESEAGESDPVSVTSGRNLPASVPENRW